MSKLVQARIRTFEELDKREQEMVLHELPDFQQKYAGLIIEIDPHNIHDKIAAFDNKPITGLFWPAKNCYINRNLIDIDEGLQ